MRRYKKKTSNLKIYMSIFICLILFVGCPILGLFLHKEYRISKYLESSKVLQSGYETSRERSQHQIDDLETSLDISKSGGDGAAWLKQHYRDDFYKKEHDKK